MFNEMKKRLQLGQKILLKVRIRPQSGKHTIGDFMTDGSLKISLKSAPEDGKANQELIKLLSDFFKIKEQNIRILSGKTARKKLIEINP